ncbi:alpha/beta hydrolase fold protein, partial [Tanacetum coccineum]
EFSMMVELADALEKQGISAFRFDFSGNGESEGTFEFGEVSFRVTDECLLERLNTNMHEAGLSIDQDCKVLTIHGSEYEIIPVVDGLEFAMIIANHKLQIVEGADHCYNKHREELVSTILAFIKENLHRFVGMSCCGRVSYRDVGKSQRTKGQCGLDQWEPTT